MSSTAESSRAYFPPPESQGGWRRPGGPEATRRLAGIALDKLEAAREWNAQLGIMSSVVVIRHGYMVAEWHEQGAGPGTTYNIHSCTKSFTGTAYGMLFDDARKGLLGQEIGLDTPAYAHIPQGYPLSDPRKQDITLRHLLSMSSGMRGEQFGVFGVVCDAGTNPFAAALGRAPVKARESGELISVAELAGEPGSRWDYCDPAFSHLALIFHNVTGRELSDYVAERVFGPIGIEGLTWDSIGIEGDDIGRHTTPFSGVHVSARELARFGYLMLRRGAWRGRQIVPTWWLDEATQSSQPYHPIYGLTWWLNYDGKLWQGTPGDAFAAMGYNTNLCCVIPSLDMVAVRVGNGPTESTEFVSGPFFAALAGALVE